MWAEVAVEVLVVAGAFRASKAGWIRMRDEESRDFIAGGTTGFFDFAPPTVPPALRSE